MPTVIEQHGEESSTGVGNVNSAGAYPGSGYDDASGAVDLSHQDVYHQHQAKMVMRLFVFSYIIIELLTVNFFFCVLYSG
jgi:hypothetical protein